MGALEGSLRGSASIFSDALAESHSVEHDKGVGTVRDINGNQDIALTLDNSDRRFYFWR
jgi:hypothetical protein